MKVLDRKEMKSLKGGSTWHCGCLYMPGAWTYSDTPTTAQRGQDIATYCNGGGACWLTSVAP